MPLLVASKYRSCIILLLLLSCCCQFCRLFASTVEQCQTAALERLEADAKLKRLNFGSQSYSPPKSSVSSATQRVDSDTTPKKGAGFDLLEWAKRKWGCKNLGLKKKKKTHNNYTTVLCKIPIFGCTPIHTDFPFALLLIDFSLTPWQITSLRQSIHHNSHTIRVACLEGGDCKVFWFE